MSLISSGQSISLPDLFRWDEVSSLTTFKPATTTTPPLGPLASFTGTFTGNGFNTIFRPNSPFTPTPLPLPPIGPDDNVLELNLTQEALTFSAPLGSIPNRGFVQGDIFLNGVPYIQSIQDVTVPTQPVGIHFEPGVWLAVPETTNPAETNTFVRMASIPHGTTVLAQGTSVTVNGPPNIAPVDITPFVIGQPGNRIAFPSQTAATDNTFRIPQNLAPFVAAGTITQAMLTDPNTFLRNHIVGQNITSTTVIQVFTPAALPLFGGGTANIAFLLGQANASKPNAEDLSMVATFWIETVEHFIIVPPFAVGHPPLTLPAAAGGAGEPVTRFIVDPPNGNPAPRLLTVTSTQIQYSQLVLLNFNGLSWPHVSVATLVPSAPVPVPTPVWAQPFRAAPVRVPPVQIGPPRRAFVHPQVQAAQQARQAEGPQQAQAGGPAQDAGGGADAAPNDPGAVGGA